MKEKLQKIKEQAIAEIEKSEGLEKLNEVRQSILGKKGELTAVLKGMKDVGLNPRKIYCNEYIDDKASYTCFE